MTFFDPWFQGWVSADPHIKNVTDVTMPIIPVVKKTTCQYSGVGCEHKYTKIRIKNTSNKFRMKNQASVKKLRVGNIMMPLKQKKETEW